MTAITKGLTEIKTKEAGYSETGIAGEALYRGGLVGRKRSDGKLYNWTLPETRNDLEFLGLMKADCASAARGYVACETILLGVGSVNGVTVAGVTAATDEGKPVFCSTNNWNADLTLTETGMPIGRIHKWISTTYCEVEIFAEKLLFDKQFTYTETFTHADLADTAAVTKTIALGFSLPAKAEFLRHYVDCTTGFTGGVISTAVIDIGTAGNDDYLIDNTSVFAAALLITPDATYLAESQHIQSNTASTGLNIIFTFDQNVNTSTAGSLTVHIYWGYVRN